MTKRREQPKEVKAGPVRKRAALRDNPLRKISPIVELLRGGSEDAPLRIEGESSGRPHIESSGRPQSQTSGRQIENVDGMPSTFQTHVDGMPSRTSEPGRPHIETLDGHTFETKGRPELPNREYHRLPKETIRLKSDILKRIKVFCAERGISKQEFWETLAVQFFETLDGKSAGGFEKHVDGMPSHDDMMIRTFTDDNIIMAYRRLTRQTWKPADDTIGRRYNGTDPRLVEVAVIRTIEKKLRGSTAKLPIRSFNYFVPELEGLIQEVGQLPGGIDEYYRYVLSKWPAIEKTRNEKWKL